MNLDQANLTIIKHLRNGRKSYKKIAEELSLSENTVRSRVHKLMQEGILEISGVLLEFYTEEVSQIRDVQSVETFVVYKSYNLKIPYVLD